MTRLRLLWQLLPLAHWLLSIRAQPDSMLTWTPLHQDHVILVPANHTLSLDCLNGSASGQEDSFTWLHQRAAPHELGHVRTWTLSQQGSRLRLWNVSEQDAGSYVCVGEQEEEHEWQLVVMADVQPESGIAVMYEGVSVANQSVIPAEAGDVLVLVCLLYNRPDSGHDRPQDGSWLSGSDHIRSVNFFPALSDLVRVSAVRIELPDTDLVRRHVVSCSNGPDRLQLFIQQAASQDPSPSFTIRRVPAFGIPVLQGMKVSLMCEISNSPASGHEAPRPHWIKDNVAVASDQVGTLTLMSVDASDIGWYQCVVEQDGHTFSSIGYFLNVQSNPSAMLNQTRMADGQFIYQESPEPSAGDDCFGCCLSVQSGMKDLKAKLDYWMNERAATVSITLLNDTQIPTQMADPDRVVARVCGHPRPHNIIWITPTLYAVKPDHVSRDGWFSVLKSLPDPGHPCVISTLTISPQAWLVMPDPRNEFIIVAGNGLSVAQVIFSMNVSRPGHQPDQFTAASSSLSPNYIMPVLIFILLITSIHHHL